MSFINVVIGVFITLLLTGTTYALVRKVESRKKKRLQYALLAFQSHTNPHFIKNVLQAINWFILNNEKELASDYLCDFSILMEDILKFSKQNFVTLSEKLEFLDLYLKLQHLRHNDKFDYVPLGHESGLATIHVSEEINPSIIMLPPLLIHPFIENAIEHGLKARKGKGSLTVSFEYKSSRLVCTVCDDGIGIKESKKIQSASKILRSNLGIINTKKRIDIIRKLYGINISVVTTELLPAKENPGTKVELNFPMPLNFNPTSGMPEQIYNV